MEKDNDSIATIQMKPEYAASEVYSTASEPPPAYKMRNSNSVKIAKIVAVTIVLSSFIIGLFVLGSTYLQAKASCNYMDSVQAALEKELLMDRFDDFPRAEALHDSDTTNILSSNEKSEILKKSIHSSENEINENEIQKPVPTTTFTDSESNDVGLDNSSSDESEELKRIQVKLPLELELDHIANAILEQNRKAKMNCIVERRRAEETVDAPGRTIQLPFGLNLNTDPKQKMVTGERLVIMCESGMEHPKINTNRVNNDEEDDVEEIRQIVVPINAVPLQFGPRGPQYPLTHLPMIQQLTQQIPQVIQAQMHQIHPQMQQQMNPQVQQSFSQMFHPQPQTEMRPPPFAMSHPPQVPQIQQLHQLEQTPMMHQLLQPQNPIQFHQIQRQQMIEQPQPQQDQMLRQLPPQPHSHPAVPAQMVQAPRPEMPEVRIQLQRVQMPIGIESRESRTGFDEVRQPNSERDMQQIHVQQVPLGVALQRAGITAEDLRNIQHMAEERIQEEFRNFVSEDDNSDNENNQENSDSSAEQHIVQIQQIPQQRLKQEEQREVQDQDRTFERELLPIGRMISFGRSLINPIRIPIPMMQQVSEESNDEPNESERPHFVHPRSVENSVSEHEKKE
jgi:hypothetical protein